jgi:hypothetical protein
MNPPWSVWMKPGTMGVEGYTKANRENKLPAT